MRNKKKVERIKKIAKAAAVAIPATAACLFWGNKSIQITRRKIKNRKIPKSFSGYRIVQISDLHDAEFGRNNKRLIRHVKQENPDLIAITGDIVYGRGMKPDVEMQLIDVLVKIAPVCFVMGNHEAGRYLEYQKLEKRMIQSGVQVLRNDELIIEAGDEKVRMLGIDDPKVYLEDKYKKQFHSMIRFELQNFKKSEDYTVLLSHRPEAFFEYVNARVDLVLSGHAHGGQFRLPFVGGLFAPNQGFLPKYDAGRFKSGETTMYVSRGLGRSLCPIRIGNRPELVVIELHNKK